MTKFQALLKPTAAIVAGSLLILIGGSGCQTAPAPRTTNPHGGQNDRTKDGPTVGSSQPAIGSDTTNPHG